MRNEYVKQLDAIGTMNVALARELLGKGLIEQGAKALEREIHSIESKVGQLKGLLAEVQEDIT